MQCEILVEKYELLFAKNNIKKLTIKQLKIKLSDFY